jgi:hypothetical protein
VGLKKRKISQKYVDKKICGQSVEFELSHRWWTVAEVSSMAYLNLVFCPFIIFSIAAFLKVLSSEF